MHVQLGVAKPVGNSRWLTVCHELRTDDVAIELVRNRPVGDSHNAVIKSDLECHPRMVCSSTSFPTSGRVWAMTDSRRTVQLSRIGKHHFQATNSRGGTLSFGRSQTGEFTPVELL